MFFKKFIVNQWYVAIFFTFFSLNANKKVLMTIHCHYHINQCKEYFEELGYEIHRVNKITNNLPPFDYFIIIDKLPPKNFPYPKEKLIFMLQEPPIFWPQSYNKKNHNQFSKILTWDDRLVDNKHYFKIHHPQRRNLREPFEIIPFDNKKFCVLINSHAQNHNKNELYSKRKDAIDFFIKHAPNDLDLYGKNWHKWKKNIPCYKGPLPGVTWQNSIEKIKKLNEYKFCICYENTQKVPGYVTEKIFDCLRARCVPIYWGAPNITDYVPRGCFIPREKFKNNEELYRYLKTMTEQEYQSYIDNINEYLFNDPRIDLFSLEYFAYSIVQAIESQ